MTTLAHTVAGKPTIHTIYITIISESNSTHVDITVSWESPGDPVTDGYVIYYQPNGGPVISDSVFGGETDTHSLDGLQRGVTYYISLVALSPHLPSPLAGPITVITGESLTSPSSHHVLMSLSLSLIRSTTGSRDFTRISHYLTQHSVLSQLYCQS